MAAKKDNPFRRLPVADEAARTREVEALLGPRRVMAQEIPLTRIRPNPYQARTTFEDIEELAEVIRVQGFISRLRVRPDPALPGYFQLVFGERRLRAADLAGLEVVPCEIAEHTDAELIEIGLAENIQRRDLQPLEEARAFQTCIEQQGYSIRSLAERIGKNKGYVENRLALLKVPVDVQQMVEARPDALRAAREIGKLPEAAARAPLIRGVLDGSLSDHDVRSAVQQRADGAWTEEEVRDASPARRTQQARLKRDAETLRRVVANWRAMIPDLEPEGAAQLLDLVEALQTELTSLTGYLRR